MPARFLVMIALLVAAEVAGSASAAGFGPLATQASKAVLPSGASERMQNAFAKVPVGGTVMAAVIGGSSTADAKASEPDARHATRIAASWRTQFPGAKVVLVNGGIGATGSNFGALRARRDLLSKQPDFVVVEYAVNGGPRAITRNRSKACCVRFSRSRSNRPSYCFSS